MAKSGVLSGKKLYLVVNADGTSAGNKLANGGTVTVSGKIMSKGGMNMITANSRIRLFGFTSGIKPS